MPRPRAAVVGCASDHRARPEWGRIARPVECEPDQEHMAHLAGPEPGQEYPRRVDLAVERPATGEQFNTGVQSARPQAGE